MKQLSNFDHWKAFKLNFQNYKSNLDKILIRQKEVVETYHQAT